MQIENQADYGVELVDVSDTTSLLTGKPTNRFLLEEWAKKDENFVMTKSQVFDCALMAVGITTIGDLISSGINGMSKSAVKKVLKKVAVRYMGWVGAGIALYEFGDCMSWW